MKTRLLAFAAILSLTACQQPSREKDEKAPGQPKAAAGAADDSLKFVEDPPAREAFAAPESMRLEVALDRLGYSSGVIDGKQTRFDALALRGFQAANALDETGLLDEPTKAALAKLPPVEPTRIVRIPAAFARGPFVPDLPNDTSKQANFEHLGYRNLMEALAERFHTTPETLVALNGPQAKIGAGLPIRVPNVADADMTAAASDERGWNGTLVSLGISSNQAQAEKIVVSKSQGSLRAYDGEGHLLVQFPATMGSEHDPLPLGNWKVLGVSRNPDFHYNPKLFWDVSDSQQERLLKPGPNGPVGVAWIDLSKEHYGIHGTGEPASIGRSESHGCVRLTNWDVARLAQMVKPGVAVVFER